MPQTSTLRAAYPWTKSPLLACAPMLNIATPSLAISVSAAGGLGFLAAGYDVSNLEQNLNEVSHLVKTSPNTSLQAYHTEKGVLPIGVGFLIWGADLHASLAAIKSNPPVAVWLFAPSAQPDDLRPWADRIRAVSAGRTAIWAQVGTVAEALAVSEAICPDVLVVQGCDAGGHGLARSASVLTLVPEVTDALRERGDRLGDIPVLAAGGIVDGRGLAASLALGARGVVLGTRFLAANEATLARGYRDRVLGAADGGVCTARSTVYDRVRGINGWPGRYDGRGVINESYVDAVERGMSDEENKRLYEDELKKGDAGWAPEGRLTTYAGTGVGLVREAMPAADIVESVLLEAKNVLASCAK
ncbi:2-nitropropane dioxygenase [Aspergillus sp. HF37]|nr:2-nitropropane dioxygenase [Aspergillus sp. HF37]